MKNWLFIGRAETGWQSAVIYTLVEQIRSAGKNPEAYLKWLFEKLIAEPSKEQLPALLPKAWLSAQEVTSALQAKCHLSDQVCPRKGTAKRTSIRAYL